MSTIHVLYRTIEVAGQPAHKIDRMIAWYQFAEKASQVAERLNDAISENDDPMAALAILTKVDTTVGRHIDHLNQIYYYTLPVEEGQ